MPLTIGSQIGSFEITGALGVGGQRLSGEGKVLAYVRLEGTESRFELPPFSDPQATPYDVAPDGQRFIVVRRRGAAKPTTLSVPLSWHW